MVHERWIVCKTCFGVGFPFFWKPQSGREDGTRRLPNILRNNPHSISFVKHVGTRRRAEGPQDSYHGYGIMWVEMMGYSFRLASFRIRGYFRPTLTSYLVYTLISLYVW